MGLKPPARVAFPIEALLFEARLEHLQFKWSGRLALPDDSDREQVHIILSAAKNDTLYQPPEVHLL
jgi:hypothetical protein